MVRSGRTAVLSRAHQCIYSILDRSCASLRVITEYHSLCLTDGRTRVGHKKVLCQVHHSLATPVHKSIAPTEHLHLSCLQLRDEQKTCGNHAAYFVAFAAITSHRGVEEVTTFVEGSDPCMLTSAGCTFDADGQPVLSHHMQSGVLQALARHAELKK